MKMTSAIKFWYLLVFRLNGFDLFLFSICKVISDIGIMETEKDCAYYLIITGFLKDVELHCKSWNCRYLWHIQFCNCILFNRNLQTKIVDFLPGLMLFSQISFLQTLNSDMLISKFIYISIYFCFSHQYTSKMPSLTIFILLV